MKRPAVFFDRDNTLIANDGYLGDPSRVVLVDGAAEAIARVRSMGFATVVVSNQSGVARGMFNEDAVRAVDARMNALLLEQNPLAVVDRHEYCPYHPEAVIDAYRQDSPMRKPKPGMLRSAAEAMALDLPGSWMVGDAPRDIAAGKAAGCRTILFSDPALLASPAVGSDAAVIPDYTAASLNDAVDLIEQHAERFHFATVQSRPAPVKPAAAVVTKATTLAANLAIKKLVVPASLPVSNPAPQPLPKIAPKPETALAPAPAPAVKPEETPVSPKLELLAEQILVELRRRSDIAPDDFSVAKLLAGITQIAVMAVLLMGYLQGRDNVAWLQIYMLLALTFQAMTISLLVMSRQK